MLYNKQRKPDFNFSPQKAIDWYVKMNGEKTISSNNIEFQFWQANYKLSKLSCSWFQIRKGFFGKLKPICHISNIIYLKLAATAESLLKAPGDEGGFLTLVF